MKKIDQAEIDKWLAYENMPAVLDYVEIRKVLPHRYPMLLVDKIVELVPMQRAVGIKCVTGNEPFFQGHFPDYPIMPGVLIVEAMAQVGGLALMYPKENRNKRAVFGRINNVRFKRQVLPGDVLVTEAIITRVVRDTMGIVKCVSRVRGQVACECECHFALIQPKDN